MSYSMLSISLIFHFAFCIGEFASENKTSSEVSNSDLLFFVGKPIILSCRVEPGENVTWSHEHEEIKDWEKFHIQTGSDGDESILKIDSAVPSDAGYYNCNKQDLFYVVVEPPIELTIMDESNRTLGPVVNLTVDQSVSFICHGSLHENSTIDADRVILEWIYETGEIIPNANYTSWTNIEVGEKNMSGTHYYCQLNFNATIDYNATDLICRFAEDDLELASGSIRLEFVSDKVRVNRYGFEFGIGVILLAGVSGTVSCYIIYKKRHNRITFVE